MKCASLYDLSLILKDNEKEKMKYRSKKASAHLGTFACPNGQATSSQAEESVFDQRPNAAELKPIED